MSFSSLSLRNKLLLSFSLLAVFLGVTGGIGLHSLKEVTGTYGRVAEVNLPNLKEIDAIFLSQKDIVITVMSLAGGLIALASGRFALGQVAVPVGVGIGVGTGVPIVTSVVTAVI